MVEKITTQGMIISQSPMGEYDKRVVILTTSMGRITAFANGARRQGNPLMGNTESFCFGEFTLHPGKNAYSLKAADISNYFAEVKKDLELTWMGMYFLEFASYYTREGVDETATLKLLYKTLLVMGRKELPLKLIRRVFELKLMTIHGEAPHFGGCINCGETEGDMYFDMEKRGLLCSECKRPGHGMLLDRSTLYTLQYIQSAPVEKLYSFRVSDSVQLNLDNLIEIYIKKYVDKMFKSKDMLEILY